MLPSVECFLLDVKTDAKSQSRRAHDCFSVLKISFHEDSFWLSYVELKTALITYKITLKGVYEYGRSFFGGAERFFIAEQVKP